MVVSLYNTPLMTAYSAAKSISRNNDNLHNIMNGYEDERNELIACNTDLQLQHPFLDNRSRFSRQLKANHHLPVEWKAKDLLFFHLLMSSWQGAALVQESHLVKIKSKLTTFPLL